jgi:acyl-CoA synthetase (AMP-forming)/AMP-acid ligase II
MVKGMVSMSDGDGALDPASAATLPQLVRSAGAAYGDALAVTLTGDTIPDDAISFRELDLRSARLARGLIALGVGKGSRVGFIYGNSPSFAVTLAAIARIGAVAIPLSTLLRSNELVRVIRQADLAGLIVQRSLLRSDYVERLCEALPALRSGEGGELRLAAAPYLRWVVSTGEGLPPAFRDIAQVYAAADGVGEDLLREIESEVHPADQMIEIYTSGSMALPKGVKHNHGPVLFRAHYLSRMADLQRGAQATAFMPMFWVGGLMMTLMPAWAAGATTVCTEGTPINSRMAMGSVLSDDDLAAISTMATGPKWALGMTETLGPYSYGDEFRAPGYPLCAPLDHIAERYEVRVWGDGPVGEGGRGEIQVRGYPLTPGLHKVERSRFFEPDGFYRTGDLGLVEGDRIHFVGRGGDMIKTASSNVSPAEVELEMQSLAGVHSAYVVGLPDAERGQLVVAAVVPREGVELDLEGLQAQLRARLSSYKVPRAYVLISRDEIPMLPSNKVSRRRLEALLAEKLGRPT